ncbi:MAG TPA: kelch repeat-containing protein, partial [Candidatus Eisenbacteria bacterium]
MTRRVLSHHRSPRIQLLEILILFVSIVVAHPGASAGSLVRSRAATSQFSAASAADSSWWTELLPPTAPPVRIAFSYVLDPVRNRLIIFGGAAAPGVVLLNDTWVLSLSEPPTWVELSPSGGPPPGRSLSSATYDPIRDRMIIFGGTSSSGSHYSNDVWALALSGTPQWTQIFPTGGPIPIRGLHSAIYDPVSDRMLVYGGFDGFTSLDDLWGLSLSGAPAWTQLTPAGAGPGARDYHRAIYDPALNSMVLFGGHQFFPTATYFNDTWSLSLSGTLAWSQIPPPDPLPSARLGMSMVYDSTRDRILVYGGGDATGTLGDAWALSLSGSPTWAQAAPTGNVPPARVAHAAVYDPSSDQMVIYGGNNGGVRLNDSWSFRWCAPCAPTAVSVFLDVADASQGVVRLRWIVPGGESALLGIVQRREEGSDWVDIA